MGSRVWVVLILDTIWVLLLLLVLGALWGTLPALPLLALTAVWAVPAGLALKLTRHAHDAQR